MLKVGENMNRTSKSKMYNIEFLRFIFSVIIVYYHILHSNIMNYTGGASIYERLNDMCNYANIIPAAFFVLSGYFFFVSYKSKPQMSIKEFTYNKIARLWPVLAFSFVIGILFFDYSPYSSFLNILFLQCIGISLDYAGITWYVSPMFWALIFYYALLKIFKDNKKINFLICIIVYFSFTYNINCLGGGFGRATVNNFISLGLLSGLAGVGFGYLIGVSIDNISNLEYVKNFKPNKLQSVFITLVISVVELACFAYMIYYSVFSSDTYKNIFFNIFVFSVLMICMITGKGLLSRITNNKYIGFVGKYSYSIYIMQQISFYILQRTLWQNTDYVQHHAYRCLAISVAFSVLVGVVVYYVIEKPCAVAFKKFGKKLFAVKKTAEN